MLPFHPVLMSLTPVWFVGIVVRACLERVVTCSCRAVLKHLGVHTTSFLLLASSLYLTISTEVPSSSSHDPVATVLRNCLHPGSSGPAAEPARDERQGVAKSSKFPGTKCRETEGAPAHDPNNQRLL